MPVWTGAIGRPSEVVGATAYGTAGGHCITAVDVATGHFGWAIAPTADHPALFDVVADASTVLAATGVAVGQGPGLVISVIDRLVAYDATTGRPRWGVTIPGDGQKMPARLAGSVVVISEADGSLLGLSENSGHEIWRDRAPRGCSADTQGGVQPDAAVIGLETTVAGEAAVVAFSCDAGDRVAAIDPAHGTTRWTWRVPVGWNVDPQMTSTVETGGSGGGVVAAAISLIPKANAPATVAPPPGPAIPTRIGDVYGYSQTEDVVALGDLTGRTLWDLTGVVGPELTLGGAGSVCVLTDAGTDCRGAIDGAPRWTTRWPGANANATQPALSCIDMAVSAQPCAVAANGLLYLALASDSAPSFPTGPEPPSPAGTFAMTSLRMDTGKVMSRLPLPAFDVQSDHAVSLGLPPAVLVVADGLVLVSPQYEETDTVEAFAV